MNIINRFQSLPVSSKRLLSLGAVLALFVALPLFIWAIVSQTFLINQKAASGEPGVCTAINKTIVVTPTTDTNGNCHDLQTAINAVNGSGYTILVKPGVYYPNGTVTIDSKTALTITGDAQMGNSGTRINFVPGGWGFLVKNSSGSIQWMSIQGGSSNGMISVQNSSDFQLGYLNVNSTTSHTVDVQGSVNVNIYNNEIQSSAGALEIGNSQNTTVSNNKIYNSDNAISVNSSGGTVIMGNLVTQNRESGLSVYNASNTNVNHNTFINNALKGSGFPAVALNADVTLFNFSNNLVVYNYGPGVAYNGVNFTRTFGHNDVWTNNGGDYVGMDSYTGVNGNISADPKINFSNWLNLCLNSGSPAVYGNLNNYEYMGYIGLCGTTPTPTPSCAPRPACLDSRPACLLPEPVNGWCPTPTPQPILKVIAPNGGESLTVGQKYTIKWQGPGRSTYLLYLVNSLGEQSLINGASASATSYTWTVNSPIMKNTNLHKIKIIEARTAGALSDVSDNYFKISSATPRPTPTPTPTPTCAPRPACLDSVPACEMPEPIGGWCATPTPTPTPTSAPIMGDVNHDGKVNIVDIGIVIDNYRVSPITVPDADVNHDGIVNIIDIGIIVDNYQF